MALAQLIDHVIGVDPDRGRTSTAVVCSKTQGELASKVFPTTAPRLWAGVAVSTALHDRGSAGLVD